jgi:D-alanyl-D-alanine carboxypeptidase
MKKYLLFLYLYIGLQSMLFSQSIDVALSNKLQQVIDSMQINNSIKGISSCVIFPGSATWKGVSGISYSGEPITADMEFGLGSNTKLFTGVLLLKLAEQQLIHLDDSLHQYLPTFNNIDSTITIRQLLNHTSGLQDVIDVPGYIDSILLNPNRVFTASELISWIGPPLYAAGSGWNYSNTNYLLAGMIAESVTGQSYAQLLHDYILSPLQLDSTFLGFYDTIPYQIAHPWQGNANNFSVPRISLNSAAWAAGAMYSTSGEMAHWYDALMSGNFLNDTSFNDMTTFVGAGNYGIGISRYLSYGRTVWRHGGSIWGGYNSEMMYDSASGIVICVLTNQLPGNGFQVAEQMLHTIFAHLLPTVDRSTEFPFVVYPNPSNEMIALNISNELRKKVAGIQIKNSNGMVVFSNNHFNFETPINTKDWGSAGIYLMELIDEHHQVITMSKFILH